MGRASKCWSKPWIGFGVVECHTRAWCCLFLLFVPVGVNLIKYMFFFPGLLVCEASPSPFAVRCRICIQHASGDLRGEVGREGGGPVEYLQPAKSR